MLCILFLAPILNEKLLSVKYLCNTAHMHTYLYVTHLPPHQHSCTQTQLLEVLKAIPLSTAG